MEPYAKLPLVLLSELASGKWDSNNCRIAEWLLNHLEKVETLSIQQLAAETFVSKSAVSRFCRDVGLEDFSELRELWQSAQSNFTAYGQNLPPWEQAAYLAGMVKDSLDMAVETLDYAALDRLVADLRQTGRAALLGLLKSESVALNLQSELIQLGVSTVTKLSYREQLDYLNSAGQDNLIIILSYRGLYFDYGLPRDILRRRPPLKLWLVAGNPELKTRYPTANVLSFCSKLDYASHPHQLQFVANLIAQRYAAQAG